MLAWIIGGLGIASAGAFIWFWGYNRNQRKLWQAEKDVENAKSAQKVAGIFAKPSGSKSDIINRL